MVSSRVKVLAAIAAALLLYGACAFAAEYKGPPAEPYRLGGLSFTSQKNLDVLRMSAPVGVTPEVYRHAIPQRVVMRFDSTIPLESLNSLVSGKRGDCIEKIEVQALRNYADDAGGTAGVRQFSAFSTLVIVYVPTDVDATVTSDAGVIEAVFQRVGKEPTRPSPLPVNTLEDITFELQGNRETVTFFFAEPVTPSVYEEVQPHRLLLAFPETLVPDKVRNQIKRFMQTPLLMRVEGFNIGSMPQDYIEMDEGREFHFTSYPSPLADDAFADKIFGKQTRDAITVFYPFDDVTFRLPETEKNIVKVVFDKRVEKEEMVCTKFEPVKSGIEVLYSLEDEEGRRINEEKRKKDRE